MGIRVWNQYRLLRGDDEVMKSIMQEKKECYICQTQCGLHSHHIIFGNPGRRLSERYGLKVWLCWEHHEGTYGVHGKYGASLNKMLKQLAQLKFEENHTREEFIEIFGRNYLD